MSRCLSEYALLMLYTGEETEQEFGHLSTCQGCSRRYQDLVRDWQRIERIFHYVPPLNQRWLAQALLLREIGFLVWQPWRQRW
jgi:hypothetical protein